jgi:hypothetical protein
MEAVVKSRRHSMIRGALFLMWLAPAMAAAQPAEQALPDTPARQASEASSLWLVAGGTFATVRGDCQTCEEDYPYRHAGSVLANVGYRVNGRMDVGAEVFWIPLSSASGHIRTTHIDAVAQFRPWGSKGFFLKGGAGMAFVRNWVDVIGEPINSKALSVVIGAGWEFRWTERFRLQLFGAQHAAALGDLQTGETKVNDVLANFWSVGAAIVIR